MTGVDLNLVPHSRSKISIQNIETASWKYRWYSHQAETKTFDILTIWSTTIHHLFYRGRSRNLKSKRFFFTLCNIFYRNGRMKTGDPQGENRPWQLSCQDSLDDTLPWYLSLITRTFWWHCVHTPTIWYTYSYTYPCLIRYFFCFFWLFIINTGLLLKYLK